MRFSIVCLLQTNGLEHRMFTPKRKQHNTSNCPKLDGVGKNKCGLSMRCASAAASALQRRLIQDSQAVADLESFAVLVHGEGQTIVRGRRQLHIGFTLVRSSRNPPRAREVVLRLPIFWICRGNLLGSIKEELLAIWACEFKHRNMGLDDNLVQVSRQEKFQ